MQDDFNVANASGPVFRADLNNNLLALATLSSGATAPSTTFAFQLWADTTSGLLKQRNASNTAWLVRGTLTDVLVESRASNTMLGIADFGKTILATSTFTQTFAAAATLGSGWYCRYVNDGTGVVTLDPNGAESIDGAATYAMSPGESVVVVSNGSALRAVGRSNIAALDTDASPDTSADFIMSYDASAARLRKVSIGAIGLPAASQADMESAASTTVSVTPGRQHFHPGTAKAWVFLLIGLGVQASYAFSSVTVNGVGDITYNWSRTFSSGNYAAVATAGSLGRQANVTARTTTSTRVVTSNQAFALEDNNTSVVVFGDI